MFTKKKAQSKSEERASERAKKGKSKSGRKGFGMKTTTGQDQAKQRQSYSGK